MNTQNDEASLSQNLQKQVYAEQVQLLYSSMFAAVIANIIASILFISIQWQVIEKPVLLAWLIVSVVIILLRATSLIIFKRSNPSINDIKKWGTLFLIGSSASGLILGSAGIFLFPEDEPISQVACAFVLLGMSSGAVSSLSFGKYNFLIYATLALFPLIISLSLENTRLSLILIPMIVLSFVFLLKSSNTIYKNTQQNILLRLQAIEREKELLKSQQRYKLHIEKTPLGVIEWDTDFKVTGWNASAEKIFGYTKEEALGQHAKSLIILDNAIEYVESVWEQLLATNGGTHSENENITKYGKIITSEWFNTVIVDNTGDVIGVTSLVQDISERKHIEKMKNEFVASVSHELRTPLNAINGYSSLLEEELSGLDNDNVSLYIDNIHHSGEALLYIVNNLLDLSDITAGKVKVDNCPVDFDMIVTQLQKQLEKDVEENGNKLICKYDDIAPFEQDYALLKKVLFELMMNANKFTVNGEVSLSASLKKIDGTDGLCINITDNGCGMTEETISHIFSAFSQADSSLTRSYEGLGLGLTLVEKCVSLINGHIEVESELGKGSRFTIFIPYHPVT